mmetsp:Transcript_4071/g.4863  ORF Transcript_4071/g.4863 Transcript_4071/m.4863 type:complete len:358 (-) Transcript_4071:189-1262(-)|eukprot:CAMPEP_0195269222 /NCGR_PEP_ID=MMETSP0706-20130129/13629_1 /TAXON_ID=33640 /ORGANISM="Asterionellopsis glacialis, Strain CCMP134" /LENGTH=357 /DNA_ID=CAMNT_0040324267 /DNA_START=34 /DNA_END=1107 /DNA_ORIENTATION=+
MTETDERSTSMMASLTRAMLILVCGMLLFHLPTVLYKARLTFRGIMYLIFCNDKSWKKPQDPASIIGPFIESGGKIEKKTIYFVRHGESTWNDTFNKGKHRSAVQFALGFLPGLIKAVSYESWLVLTGKIDSWFYDSPMSFLGQTQVDELAKFMAATSHNPTSDEKHLAVLRGDPGAPPSTILCSSLRRALSTMAAGFRDRLSRRPEESILVIPSLQEISRNPDTLSITPAFTEVKASWIDRESKICDFQAIFTKQVDVSLHSGNKPINTNGLLRMTEFCDYCFSSVKEDHIIAGGHSIYFRSFFRTFLPYTEDHIAKKNKIVNAGVVAFDLIKASTPNGEKYMVDPKSVSVVFGGF